MRKLRLIDFDQVSLSSLNRHALATRADVGMPKATCLKASSTPHSPSFRLVCNDDQAIIVTIQQMRNVRTRAILSEVDRDTCKWKGRMAWYPSCRNTASKVACTDAAGALQEYRAGS